MDKKVEPSKKIIFIAIIIIALGITFSTILKDTVGLLGIVFIAVGGLFFIIGMSKKRIEDKQKDQ